MNNTNYHKYLKYKEKYLNLKNKNIYIGGGKCILANAKECTFILNNNTYKIELGNNNFILYENSNEIHNIQINNINIFMAINTVFLLLKKKITGNLYLNVTNKTTKNVTKYEITSDKTSQSATIDFLNKDSYMNFYNNEFECEMDEIVPTNFNGDDITNVVQYTDIKINQEISPKPTSNATPAPTPKVEYNGPTDSTYVFITNIS